MALMVLLGPGPCGRDGGSSGICQLLRTSSQGSTGGDPSPQYPGSLCGGDSQGGLVMSRGCWAGTLSGKLGGGEPHSQFPGQDLSNAAAAGDLGHLAGGSSCCQDDTEPQGQSGLTHPNVCSDLGQRGS